MEAVGKCGHSSELSECLAISKVGTFDHLIKHATSKPLLNARYGQTTERLSPTSGQCPPLGNGQAP